MSAPNYASILTYYDLKECQLKVECPENVLRKLASKIDKWRELTPHLELDTNVKDAVDRENSSETEKRYEILQRWVKKFAHTATCERLIHCLLNAGRTDLAEVVCKAFKELPSLAEENTIQDISATMKTDPNSAVVPGTMKAFPSNVQREEIDAATTFSNRDIPFHQVETVGTSTLRARHGDERNGSTMEKSKGGHLSQMVADRNSEMCSGDHSSKMVADNMPPSHLTRIQRGFNTLMGDISMNERDWELKEREWKVKESDLKSQLVEVMKREKDLQECLEQKKAKIEQLKENLYQKEMELVNEKQEKSELEKQLGQIRDELEREKKAKKDIEEKLQQTLKEHLEKAKKEVEILRKEKEKSHKQVTKYFQQQKKTLTTYRTIVIFLIVIITSLIFFNIGILK